MSSPSEPRRYLIAIGSPYCQRMGLDSLKRVETDIERVVKLFTSETQGYKRVLEDQIGLGDTAPNIKNALSRWFSSPERNASDCVIVYYAGHGDEVGNFGSHYLLTLDSVAQNLSSTAIETSELVKCFFEGAGERSANILLILDVCYAGQGGDQLTEALSKNKNVMKGSGFWVIASVDSNTEAADGAFVDALGEAMRDFDWMLSQVEFLNPQDLKDVINDCLKRECQNKNQAILQAEVNSLKNTTPPLFFRNPKFKRQKIHQVILQEQAECFTQDLGKSVNLDMIFIPCGRFLMGSSDFGVEQNENEKPQHEVIVPSFFMGKHQVTQAQWRVVATLPEINCKLNPNPSYFKGDSRPVESISWYEIKEFCQRLSKYTDHDYRLPSEAEWEYACRAGTMTPFHFGETLTTELANYLDSHLYEDTGKGKYVGKTTTVMTFLPNAFGLYDMHGNVREWCSDHWHANYRGAPSDGSAWVTGGNNLFRILRGGSCSSRLEDCRSANRYKDVPSYKSYNNGFRIACSSI